MYPIANSTGDSHQRSMTRQRVSSLFCALEWKLVRTIAMFIFGVGGVRGSTALWASQILMLEKIAVKVSKSLLCFFCSKLLLFRLRQRSHVLANDWQHHLVRSSPDGDQTEIPAQVQEIVANQQKKKNADAFQRTNVHSSSAERVSFETQPATNWQHHYTNRPVATRGHSGGNAPQILLGPEKFLLKHLVKTKIFPP